MSLQISNLYLLDLNLLNNTKWLVWVSHGTRGNKRKECDMQKREKKIDRQRERERERERENVKGGGERKSEREEESERKREGIISRFRDFDEDAPPRKT